MLVLCTSWENVLLIIVILIYTSSLRTSWNACNIEIENQATGLFQRFHSRGFRHKRRLKRRENGTEIHRWKDPHHVDHYRG